MNECKKAGWLNVCPGKEELKKVYYDRGFSNGFAVAIICSVAVLVVVSGLEWWLL